jgi:hypothetical protein
LNGKQYLIFGGSGYPVQSLTVPARFYRHFNTTFLLKNKPALTLLEHVLAFCEK